MRKIFDTSKTTPPSKNLDSTPAAKVTKKGNISENSHSSHEHREPSPTSKKIDPTLISSIHSTKGAIETIRGQITELRHDVDQIQTQINQNQTNNHRKRSVVAPNPPLTHSNAQSRDTRRTSKVESNHHNHNHHHVTQQLTPRRSHICNIL